MYNPTASLWKVAPLLLRQAGVSDLSFRGGTLPPHGHSGPLPLFVSLEPHCSLRPRELRPDSLSFCHSLSVSLPPTHLLYSVCLSVSTPLPTCGLDDGLL
ncbi:hypothetical protein E2C01_023257 [Portunus trituberculatus]|uniref:Uncharacterized protein n=1 Tax=Portunus trituberculatus TaxID=210409 RepID=A0A5B7EAN6_PORTR|nr:hypothetical protein [Portunus trituberculatus]